MVLLQALVVVLLAQNTLAQCPAQYAFNSINSKCYKVYDGKQSTFIASSQQCTQDGGQLASVHNAFESAFIQNLFTNNQVNHWVGLTTMLTGSTWSWLDGTNVDYTRWALGQPLANPAGSCAVMLAGDGTWNATDCSIPYAFVCESAVVVTTTTSTTTTTTTKVKRPVCDNGWVYFDHSSSCYYFGATKEQQYDAANFCSLHDGFLASVHSSQENDFIYSNGGTGTIWLGSHRIKLDKGCGTANCFANDDGTPFDYSNWAKGEPNDKDDKELCVQMYGAKAKDPSYWNDEACNSESDHYVCKKPPTWV